MNATDAAPLLCARCCAELTPGSGSFYQVTIEAVADPSPPVVTDKDLDTTAIRAKLEDLYANLRETSAQEANDQIYRRLIIHLCLSCYREWIENPAK